MLLNIFIALVGNVYDERLVASQANWDIAVHRWMAAVRAQRARRAPACTRVHLRIGAEIRVYALAHRRSSRLAVRRCGNAFSVGASGRHGARSNETSTCPLPWCRPVVGRVRRAQMARCTRRSIVVLGGRRALRHA